MQRTSQPDLPANKSSGRKGMASLLKMQTGPTSDQSMNNWLAWTGWVELLNIAIYSGLLWWLNFLLTHVVADLSIIGVLTLDAILLQGGLYWLLKRARFLANISATARLRAIQGLYVLNSLLMCIFPAVFVIRLLFARPPGLGDSIIGMCYYLFGLGEFIHYFWFKINMRPAERKRMLRDRQLVPARFLREYRKTKREIERTQ
ncbi:MAG: hypothetical protein JXB30_06685 [Anaerolineae bacterium]|nr:hypothetical protein [Anaerolineae bacterium]